MKHKTTIAIIIFASISGLKATDKITSYAYDEESFATRISDGKFSYRGFGSHSSKIQRNDPDTSMVISSSDLEIKISGKKMDISVDEKRKALMGDSFLVDANAKIRGEIYNDVNTGDITLMLYNDNPRFLKKILRFKVASHIEQ